MPDGTPEVEVGQRETEPIGLITFDYLGCKMSKSYANNMFYVTNITDSFPSQWYIDHESTRKTGHRVPLMVLINQYSLSIRQKEESI
jgi:hypothetical protein